MFLLSPLPSLAVAAAAADIRVGTFVMSGPLRAPAVAAWEAHSLSVLTEGRFELGIGAGLLGSVAVPATSGVEVAPPAERIRRIEQIIDRLNALGDHVHITMAAGGPRTRELAARVADTVHLTETRTWTWPATAVSSRSSRRPMAPARTGSNSSRTCSSSATVPLTRALSGPRSGPGPAPGGRRRDSATRSVAEMCDELQRRRELTGSSYITVSEPMLARFAPVVERLSGK